MATMNISLPAAMKAFVESQVATGRFANVSDYVRDLIREREAAVERLRTKIDEADASGYVDYNLNEILKEAREVARFRDAA